MDKFKNFFKEKYVYLFSFFVPFIILIIIFKESHLYPFGDFNYLDGDLYSQYLPFLSGFRDKILNGSSFEYTWNIGLGTGYRAIYAYYLASPINWLIALVNPKYLTDVPLMLILLKLSLCSVTFTYFLRKKYKQNNFLIPAISLCYALSSYMCSYCFNIIWLDGLLMFPLIISGLDALYNEKKYKLYFFSLFFTILSNYYIGMIICIFLVLYFIFTIVFDENKKTGKEIFTRIRLFVTYSFLAGTATFSVTLPAVFGLSNQSSGEFDFPDKIEFYISTLDMMVRPLILAPKSIDDNFPNLFCSVIVLLIVPAYILNKKISLKSKLKNILLIGFMLISFNCNILDYVWHGFHFPNCICARNSFIYIFLILITVYEGISNIQSLKDNYFLCGVCLAIIYILTVWKFQIENPDTTVFYKENIVYLSLFFIIAYMFISILLRASKGHYNLIYLLLFACVSYEMYMNAGVAIGSTNTRSSQIESNEKLKETVDSIKKNDNDFFRIETKSSMTYNNGENIGYKSASIFSSTCNGNVSYLYKAFGLEHFTNAYISNGLVPLANSIFAVKYTVDTQNQIYSVSENKYAFSLGFMTDDKFESSIDIDENNPFINLNRMYKVLSGDNKTLYSPIEVNNTSKTFIASSDNDIYIMCYPTPTHVEINIEEPDGSTQTKNITYMIKSYITNIGNIKAGSRITVNAFSDEDDFEYLLYASTYNDDLIKNCYDNLKNGFLDIKSYTDTSITGSVDAGDGGLLFMSVPADTGWTAYVDGVKTPIHAFKDAFISLELESGLHTIKLEYETPGLILGVFISIISISVFILLEFLHYLIFTNIRNKIESN